MRATICLLLDVSMVGSPRELWVLQSQRLVCCYYFNSCADQSEAQESWGSRSELYESSLWLCLPVDSIKTSALSIASLGEG